jgi:hypothetical protein
VFESFESSRFSFPKAAAVGDVLVHNEEPTRLPSLEWPIGTFSTGSARKPVRTFPDGLVGRCDLGVRPTRERGCETLDGADRIQSYARSGGDFDQLKGELLEINDETLILADMARKGLAHVETLVTRLRAPPRPARAREVANLLSTGVWTHDRPLRASELEEHGLPVPQPRPRRDRRPQTVPARRGAGSQLEPKLHFLPRGAIAQLGERLDRTQEVAGSSPASSIGPFAGILRRRPRGRLLLATHMQPARSR